MVAVEDGEGVHSLEAGLPLKEDHGIAAREALLVDAWEEVLVLAHEPFLGHVLQVGDCPEHVTTEGHGSVHHVSGAALGAREVAEVLEIAAAVGVSGHAFEGVEVGGLLLVVACGRLAYVQVVACGYPACAEVRVYEYPAYAQVVACGRPACVEAVACGRPACAEVRVYESPAFLKVMACGHPACVVMASVFVVGAVQEFLLALEGTVVALFGEEGGTAVVLMEVACLVLMVAVVREVASSPVAWAVVVVDLFSPLGEENDSTQNYLHVGNCHVCQTRLVVLLVVREVVVVVDALDQGTLQKVSS